VRLAWLARTALLAFVLVWWAPLVAQEGHGSAEQSEGHGGADNQTFWKIATFAILAGALGYAAAKNGGPFFRNRTAEIQQGIVESRRMRQEAEARAADMEARLANLGVEIGNLRQAARAEAEAEAQRIRQETQRDLARVQQQAEQEMESAVKAAQTTLRQYAASLAVSLARQKAQARITEGNQDQLVRTFASTAGQHSAALKAVD
jgi:F0F1-type ATP synthase membrane subunit b/b'